MAFLEKSDEKNKKESSPVFKDFIKVFLAPLLVNKILMMYFGLNYASYPGEGYGYGLAFSIAMLFLTIGRFLWKYRHIQDP